MPYNLLMSMTLGALADIVLTETRPIAIRLSAYEALNARLSECESSWAGMCQTARTRILAALAMDMAESGHVAA